MSDLNELVSALSITALSLEQFWRRQDPPYRAIGVPSKAILSLSHSSVHADLNLLYQIDQHTESHYLIQPVDPAADLGRRLQSCGYEKTMNQKPTILELTSTLLNPRTRFAGIRQFIGLVVISHLDLRSDPQKSLLPSQIVNFSRTIAPVERQAGAQESGCLLQPFFAYHQ